MYSKALWGNVCWQLFHSTVSNLKEERVDIIRPILIMIASVCRNLPCPDCSVRASHLVNTLKVNKIKTKADLITCVYQLHNKVNMHSKAPQFARKEHDLLYNDTQLVPIIVKFIQIMQINWPGERNMMYTMSRNRMLKEMMAFYKQNKDAFN